MRNNLATSSQTAIVATSQQTRFNPIEAPEIQLEQVTIALGDRDLLDDASLKLTPGIRYALVGRYVWLRPSLSLSLFPYTDGRLTGMGRESRVCRIHVLSWD